MRAGHPPHHRRHAQVLAQVLQWTEGWIAVGRPVFVQSALRDAKGQLYKSCPFRFSTHDYRRHGTTTLFAALDMAKGRVLTQCRQRHRHQEYLGFLKEIEKNVPETLEVHIIVDNYATHKHPRVKRWFAARPRFHVHFTPTYASWLNQVEIWFNRITQQAIRRGTFRSVKELVEKIDQYVQASNTHAQPFVWTATADSIFAKVQRLCERISGTAH